MDYNTLLIEDDPGLASLAKIRLEKQKIHNVFHAADGVTAIEYLEENQPDLILLDINIPMFDGWDVLEFARNKYGRESFKVIVTTARKDLLSRTKGDIEEVDAYLIKPFSSDELFAAIENVMPKVTDSE